MVFKITDQLFALMTGLAKIDYPSSFLQKQKIVLPKENGEYAIILDEYMLIAHLLLTNMSKTADDG